MAGLGSAKLDWYQIWAGDKRRDYWPAIFSNSDLVMILSGIIGKISFQVAEISHYIFLWFSIFVAVLIRFSLDVFIIYIYIVHWGLELTHSYLLYRRSYKLGDVFNFFGWCFEDIMKSLGWYPFYRLMSTVTVWVSRAFVDFSMRPGSNAHI